MLHWFTGISCMLHFVLSLFSRPEKYSSFGQISSLTETLTWTTAASTATSLVMKASPASSKGLTAISAVAISTCVASVLEAFSATSWAACLAAAAALAASRRLSCLR